MRFLKFLIATIIIIGGVGYGVYYFGTNIASDKVMDAVSTELENSGQIEEVKKFIQNDPAIKQFVEEGSTVDESTLPFSTKEQATRVLVQKVGIREIQDIQSKAQQGMSASEQAELLKEIEGKLTEEEITALKYVIYKELNK